VYEHEHQRMNAFQTAVALHRQGRLDEAEQHYRAALVAFPNEPEVLYGLGLVCSQSGRTDEAVYRFEQVLAARPGHAGALIGLAEALEADGRQQAAIEKLEPLIKAEPDNTAAHFVHGRLLKQLGRFDESREAFARAVALDPENPTFHYMLAESARFTANDTRLVALEALTRDEQRFSGRQRAELHFALFKAYDELERCDDAFAHLAEGNRLYRALVPYEEDGVNAFFRDVEATYTAEAMAPFAGTGHPSEVPIFVVGMPRSGTTLVEQILASHPDVYGAGELQYVRDLIHGDFAGSDYPAGLTGLGAEGLRRFGGYYSVRLAALAPGAKRIVDKLPANFRHLGLLHLAMPRARFIHVVRDARDTCFSSYTQLFASGLNYAYELGELGRYYRMAEALMTHWHSVLPAESLLQIRYEHLIADFETEARRLIAFCGLDWNEACLKFYETRRAVRTKSEFQVRRPLYKSSIGRWRRYEHWLGPLLKALG
jgi:tetratricopeptide (TPR) repeat protein